MPADHSRYQEEHPIHRPQRSIHPPRPQLQPPLLSACALWAFLPINPATAHRQVGQQLHPRPRQSLEQARRPRYPLPRPPLDRLMLL